ncbi:hypothetical protein WN48_00238 [Eufriesea mexicana]|uniref:Uncharacterized protein n=1 Tax=Eufriesea mexicana TaxID=516756 RepID=A0A310S8A3_9HYME|nr:hypothetical protein WN48_00238 [Eufriesea mexicana]
MYRNENAGFFWTKTSKREGKRRKDVQEKREREKERGGERERERKRWDATISSM